MYSLYNKWLKNEKLSFTFEDIAAFVEYITNTNKGAAIKAGLWGISGKVKDAIKVAEISHFLSVDVFDKQLRFDETDTYEGLNKKILLDEVSQCILYKIEEERGNNDD